MLAIDMIMGQIKRTKLLSKTRERELIDKIKCGDMEAEKELIESNLRFVVSIARKYANRKILLEDLISEGTIGMIRAARKFDKTRDIRFLTYAVWYIRIQIIQYIREMRGAVKYPQKYDSIKTALSAARTDEEKRAVFERLDIVQEKTREFIDSLVSLNASISLDVMIPSSDRDVDDSFISLLRDDTWLRLETEVNDKAMTKRVGDILKKMPEREAVILAMRFGLHDSTESMKTLEEIGLTFNLSRERIRQIELKAKKNFRRMWIREIRGIR